ncbi:MAG: DUF4349 domain-containing protein [Acidimicrobiales bacterium]|nr:DUF4349 domain-containing protein [Acidimicrobiales bacterium]
MRARRVLAVVVLGLVAGACGGASETAQAPDPVTAALASAQVDLRRVIHTADLTVRVDDAAGATEEATRLVAGAGGLIFAQRSEPREARLTLKVPPATFEPVMAELGDLGVTLKRQSKAQDVTDQVVDVDGRLRTALASAERLRVLVGDARSTGDIVSLESELAKRESEIESLHGRLRVLTSQVDMATINLRLTERGDLQLKAEVPAFSRALRAGWSALALVARVGVASAGFLLPFAPLGLAGWWAVRRRRVAEECVRGT